MPSGLAILALPNPAMKTSICKWREWHRYHRESQADIAPPASPAHGQYSSAELMAQPLVRRSARGLLYSPTRSRKASTRSAGVGRMSSSSTDVVAWQARW